MYRSATWWPLRQPMSPFGAAQSHFFAGGLDGRAVCEIRVRADSRIPSCPGMSNNKRCFVDGFNKAESALRSV